MFKLTEVKSSNVGYPRIGEKREWKKALEQFWSGKLNKETFLQQMEVIRLSSLEKQKQLGVDLIPVGDFTLYDHVLDTAVMFGLVPERFTYRGGKVDIETYFDIARGNKDAVAAEMTKWFNTNYHYIVPELNNLTPTLAENRPLAFYKEGKEKLEIDGKPVILGPITFVKLSKGYKESEFKSIVNQFVPLYVQILKELQQEGALWVQIDEPILATTLTEEDISLYQAVYQTLHQAAPQINIILQTYFESITYYEAVTSLPVQAIGLDFVHDAGQNLASLQKFGFPSDKVLAAGVIDGRNIWGAKLDNKLSLLEEITAIVPKDRLIIQPSSSLLHVPVTVKIEETLDHTLKTALAFADEKLQEIVVLTKGIREGKEQIQDEINERRTAIEALNQSSIRNNQQVQTAIQNLPSSLAEREAPYSVRQATQKQPSNYHSYLQQRLEASHKHRK